MRTDTVRILCLVSTSLVAAVSVVACSAEEDPERVDSSASELAVGEMSLWSDATVPKNPNENDPAAVELGVRFRSDNAGTINGVRFYKSTANGGTHTGHLWSSTGTLLATTTFTSETASGWQTARFSTPVSIAAAVTYVVSYHTTVGHYAGDNGYFTGKGADNGPLHAPADRSGARNGVYHYGTTAFPTDSWQASNYWVDVVFKPAAGTPPPVDGGTGTDAGSGTDAGGGTDAGSGTDAGPPPTQTRNCATSPHLCGYPDGTNTGPRAGTTFRRVPQDVTSGTGWAWESNFGRLRVTGTGAVLDSLDVTGPVVIDAPNVTLQNSIVTYCGSDGDAVAVRAGNPGNGYNGDGARILDNRLRCTTAGQRSRSGIRDIYGAANDLVARGNDISGSGNGITIERNGIASDNWIHDLGHLSGDHHSGLSNHGGASSVTFSHNTALLANTPTSGGGGLSGAITVYGDFARAQNVSVTDNLVSGGAYTFYGGINNEDIYGQPIEIHIDRNHLVCGSWVYGPVFRRSGPTNTFNGNVCDQDLSPVTN